LSRPAVTTASFSNSIFRLSCPTVMNKAYFLEYKDALSNANWVEISSVVGDGTLKSLSDSNATSRARFYRVRVQSPRAVDRRRKSFPCGAWMFRLASMPTRWLSQTVNRRDRSTPAQDTRTCGPVW